MIRRKPEKLLTLLLMITLLMSGCGQVPGSRDPGHRNGSRTDQTENREEGAGETLTGEKEEGAGETLTREKEEGAGEALTEEKEEGAGETLTEEKENGLEGRTAKGSALEEVSLPAWQGAGGCFTGEVLLYEKFLSRICTYGENIYTLCLDDLNADLVMRQICLEDKVIYESPYLRDFTLSEDGIWIYLEDSTRTSEDRYSLLLLGYDGEELLRRNITPQIKRDIVAGMKTDSSGNLYLMQPGEVEVYNREGDYLGTITVDQEGERRLIRDRDGYVYLVFRENPYTDSERPDAGRSGLFRLDCDGLTADLAGAFDGYYVSDGGEDYLYTLNDNTGFYGVDGQGEIVTIAVWEELGLDLNLPFQVQWLSEGRFLVSSRGRVVLLTPADPAVVKDKKFLVMACFDTSTYPAVSRFNQQNLPYAVKIKRYIRGDEYTVEEALQQLNQDIMEGNAPDLIEFTMIPTDYLTDRGLAADLWPYMDQDSGLDREDFILLDKLERDGSLYLFPQSYLLNTAGGLWSRFGDRYGWSLEEYLSIQSENSGDVMYNVTREEFLSTMAVRYAAEGIDWEAGTSHFDTEEFISILKAAARIREEPESGNPASPEKGSLGTRLREGSLIAAAWDIDHVAGMSVLETDTGEKLSFVGYPSVEGVGGTGITAIAPIGICSRGNTEGAWEFLRFVMMQRKEESWNYGLPVSRSLLEEEFNRAMENSGEGAVPVAEEGRQRFYELLEHSVYYGTASDLVIDIILEEAGPYLKGRGTGEEAARAIQERISMLMEGMRLVTG